LIRPISSRIFIAATPNLDAFENAYLTLTNPTGLPLVVGEKWVGAPSMANRSSYQGGGWQYAGRCRRRSDGRHPGGPV